jgi:hypothetical protein
MIRRVVLTILGACISLLLLLCVMGAGASYSTRADSLGTAAASTPASTKRSSLALPSPTPAQSVPVITYFSCDPCVVDPGGAATLSWDLSGATAAYLDGQGITAPDSTVVHPHQTTTYRLVAVGETGQSEKTVTVEVNALPIIHYFTCLPCEIAPGEQSTLSWDLSGATAAYLDGQGVTAPGGTLVAPSQTTTYRLVAVSEQGSLERLVTVTVIEGRDPETVRRMLRQSGHDIRWVGQLPLARGGTTASAIMTAAGGDARSQYLEGFKVLHENYPGALLSVGLYDGVRYMRFASLDSATFEAFLRGEIDGFTFWRRATWNVWDEWTGQWLESPASGFLAKDYVSKSFGF